MKRLSSLFKKNNSKTTNTSPPVKHNSPVMEGFILYDYDESYDIPEVQLTNPVLIEEVLPKDLLTEVQNTIQAFTLDITSRYKPSCII
jgi:hypothetical protein